MIPHFYIETTVVTVIQEAQLSKSDVKIYYQFSQKWYGTSYQFSSETTTTQYLWHGRCQHFTWRFKVPFSCG